MSYYFVIVGTQDNPLFEHEFGTSKQGGDGQARFSEQARHMNQFIVHSSLDIVEEVQWGTGQMCVSFLCPSLPPPFLYKKLTKSPHTRKKRYLKCIDKFFNNYVSCFMTGSNVKFLLLHQPPPAQSSSAAGSNANNSTNNSSSSNSNAGTTNRATSSSGASASTSIAANPTSPQTEEAVRSFFLEVYENWVKAAMNPFYRVNMEVRSPVFRQRVAAAGRKYL